MSSKPRWIRRVIKMGKDGRPKVVRDRRAGLQVERVTALAPRRCDSPTCRHSNTIAPSEEYAKVSDPNRGRRYRGGFWPEVKDYHYICVPNEARPMLRFLVRSWPGPWSSVTP